MWDLACLDGVSSFLRRLPADFHVQASRPVNDSHGHVTRAHFGPPPNTSFARLSAGRFRGQVSRPARGRRAARRFRE